MSDLFGQARPELSPAPVVVPLRPDVRVAIDPHETNPKLCWLKRYRDGRQWGALTFDRQELFEAYEKIGRVLGLR